MPTNKHRISLSPDDRLRSALETLAKKRNVAVSALSLDLIERALELEEDIHFSRVADERLEEKGRNISHENAWK